MSRSGSPLVELLGVGVRFPHYDSYGRSFKGRLLAGRSEPAGSDRFAVGHSDSLGGVDLTIGEGARIALLGSNASGKSTLIRVLAGFLVPDRGTVMRRGRTAAAMDAGVAPDPYATVGDTLRLHSLLHGRSWRRARHFAGQVVDFGDLADVTDQPVRLQPPGVKNRIAIAMALLEAPDLLLFDDVFETVDPAFARKVAEHIATALPAAMAVVVVSRRRRLLESICATAILLDHGTIAATGPLATIADGPGAGLLT